MVKDTLILKRAPKRVNYEIPPMKVKILNIHIDQLDVPEALSRFLKARIIFTPNIDHLFNLKNNTEFYEAYKKADLVLCDSKILSFYARIFLNKKLDQIAGADFLPVLCEFYKDDANQKIFLLGGSTQEHADLAVKNINNRTKRTIIVGGYSPPFGFEDDQQEINRIVQLVKNSGANTMVVGVGSPKQELFIVNNADRFPSVAHFLGLGATINYQSGLVPRAPVRYKSTGFEWLFRFVQEPKRLFTRYFIHGPKIMVDLFRFIFKSVK